MAISRYMLRRGNGRSVRELKGPSAHIDVFTFTENLTVCSLYSDSDGPTLLQNTFQVLKSWMKELKLHGPNGIVVAIAGNKSDLEDKRVVSHVPCTN